MADNKVAEAFIELRADTKEFDKALKDLISKLSKGVDFNLETVDAEKKIKQITQKLEKGLNTKLEVSSVAAAGAAGAGAAAAGASGGLAANVNKATVATKGLNIASKELNASLLASVAAVKAGKATYAKSLVQTSQLTAVRKVETAAIKKQNVEIIKQTTLRKKLNAVATKQRSIPVNTYTVAAAALLAVGKAAVNTTDQIDNLASQFDLTAESVQSLTLISQRAGLSFETIGEAVNKLRSTQAQALQGNQGFVESFKELGVTLNDLQTLGTEKLLEKIGKGLKASGDSAAGAVAGSRIFGEQFAKIQGVLTQTSVGLNELNADFIRSGEIVGNAYVAAGDSLEEDLDRQLTKLKTFAVKAGVALATLGGATADFGFEAAQAVSLETRVKATAEAAAEEEKAYRAQQIGLKIQKLKTVLAEKYNKTLSNAFNRVSDEFEANRKLLGTLKEKETIENSRLDNAGALQSAIQKETEEYEKQLSIVERIKASLQKTTAIGLSDAFQQALLNPNVGTTEALPAQGITENLLRENILRNDRQVARLEDIITDQTKIIDSLNEQTEIASSSNEKLGELVTAYGQGALFSR